MTPEKHAEKIVNQASEMASKIAELAGRENGGVLVLGTSLVLGLASWMEIFDPGGGDPGLRTLGEIQLFIESATISYAMPWLRPNENKRRTTER